MSPVDNPMQDLEYDYENEEFESAAHDEGRDSDEGNVDEISRYENQQPASVVEVPTPELLKPGTSSPEQKSSEEPQENSTSVHSEENTISEEVLALLGEAKQSEEIFGKNIPVEVSERWGKILLQGLTKDQKENLITKTLIPENFQLTKAPKLNDEVAAVLNEPTKNRDKRLEKMQNQLGSSIVGLANLTSELINKDPSKIDIITKVSEINQILLDLHYEETLNRRRLIIPMLDKGFISIIQGVKREKYLFGDNLSENIRTKKSLEKFSLQINKPQKQQPGPRRPNTTGVQGNARAPLRQPGGQGAHRAPARYYQPPPAAATRRAPPAVRRAPPQLNREQERRGRR